LGIKDNDISETPLGYTKLPRAVHELDLQDNLVVAFDLLANEDSQAFLHFDRYGITAGKTKSGDTPRLIIPDGERQSILIMPPSDFARMSLIPRQNPSTPPASIQTGKPELQLGRNIILDDSTKGEIDRALLDRYREWEQVLVLGENAVKNFSELVSDPANEPSSDPERVEMLALNGIVLGISAHLISGREAISS
jgi:hypothetical protein